MPPLPAGTSHACCHPSTRTRGSVRPFTVATQPLFAFSGTVSTAFAPASIRTARCVTSHLVTSTDRVSARVEEVGEPGSSHRSCTTNESVRDVRTSCWAARRSSPSSRSGQVWNRNGLCATKSARVPDTDVS
jgi:hypothetical protein